MLGAYSSKMLVDCPEEMKLQQVLMVTIVLSQTADEVAPLMVMQVTRHDYSNRPVGLWGLSKVKLPGELPPMLDDAEIPTREFWIQINENPAGRA